MVKTPIAGEQLLPENRCAERCKHLEKQNEAYKRALESIANSSCCGDCQEAKRVAKQTLEVYA